MAAAITRAQVREAMINSSCPVPDFKTREKGTLVWSKVYISLDGPELRFVELNFFQRGIRYFVGCICYGDTVFKDIEKETLEKVKEYIHGIKTAPPYHDPIAMDLFPKARTRSDFTCLRHMLDSYQTGRAIRDDEVREDVNKVSRDVDAKLDKEGLEEGFSEEFLSAALVLARKNLNQNPEDSMWKAIQRVLSLYATDNQQERINKALLEQFMGRLPEEKMPSQEITVPTEIAGVFRGRIASVQVTLDDIESSNTLESHLRALAALEELRRDLNALSGVMRPYITEEVGRQMVEELRGKLITAQAHPVLVDAYLNDEQQIANRLYGHAHFDDRINPDYQALSDRIQSRIEERRAALMELLNTSYGVIDLGYQADYFSASCDHYHDDYQRWIDRSWRETIANELSSNVGYRTLIEARIEEDSDVKGFTVEQYCQWIRNPKSPVGPPELKVLSGMTGRPVLVVKFVRGDFNWIDGIYLDFDKAPLIFNVDREVWSPVEQI